MCPFGLSNSLQIITVTAGHLSRMQDATAVAVAQAAPRLRPLLLSIVGDEWKSSVDELIQGHDAMSFVRQGESFISVTHLD